MPSAAAPPIIDWAGAFNPDPVKQQKLVDEIHHACLDSGFFQIVNHGIPVELTTGILSCAKELFGLPIEIKESYDKDKFGFQRGYERLRSQNFEKRGQGDFKEGYYFGRDLPEDHPNVVARKFGQGPNLYPKDVADPAAFRNTVDAYHAAMTKLSEQLLRIFAVSLQIDSDADGDNSNNKNSSDSKQWFPDFFTSPIATLRFLHYPPQAPTATDLDRGIGAHTDFGALTILLQDDVGGLQVWSRGTDSWIDVEPVPGAFVVNLGNLMMRWTNDRYLSNLHRVINKSGRERYSVPFFFTGNPDFVVKCLKSCLDKEVKQEEAKYPPIKIGDWMSGRYADTYGMAGKETISELSVTEAQKGIIA